MKQLLLITALFFTQLSFGQSDFCKQCGYQTGGFSLNLCYQYATQQQMDDASCPPLQGYTNISEANFINGCPSGAGACLVTFLPLELIDFQANSVNNQIVISWKTKSEKNNKGFGIERSNNGIDWSEIQFIKGNGDSDIINSYSYIDSNKQSSDKVFYRLKQYDYDNLYVLSEIIELSYSDGNGIENIQIYPNPVSEYIAIKNIHGTVKVFDMNSNLVLEETISPSENSSYVLPLGHLSNGAYLVQVTDKNGKVYTKKVIKQ